MKERTIYFIILNYNTAKESQNCILSIKNLEGDEWNKKIILIDNNSTDKSIEIFNKLYGDDEDVEIHKMEENLGFSKANNYGYKLIKERMDADFCVVCNSDVEFVQKDFVSRIQEEYNMSEFYICGPDVFCPSRLKTIHKGHQSPAYPYEWNKNYVKAYYQYNRIKLETEKNIVYWFKKIFQYAKWIVIKSTLYFVHLMFYRNYRERRHEDLPVHGSCFILSNLFIERESVLFYPETKFYWEEVLLYLRMKRNQYKVVYNPQIRIKHYQGRATVAYNRICNTNTFRMENLLFGAKLYLKELENEQKM